MKLGKTPARMGAIKFTLAKYVNRSALPTPPRAHGHQDLLLSWGMLGNSDYGDCVWAGADHETMLWNKLGGKDVGFTVDNALRDYSAVTGFKQSDPATDQGTDMQVAASYRRKTGVVDNHGQRHKVAAYLGIKLRDETELKTAIFLFSGVGIGIEFPDSAMDQFNDGVPWTVIQKSEVEGGHYVPAIGYDARYIYVVTWGRVQKMTWGFYRKYADEAIAYVSEEMLVKGLSQEGYNFGQLEKDLALLK